MKLTVGDGTRERGFALPTILLVSTVMLIVLVASIAATAASRVSLDSQYYNHLAQQAAQSGVARANECLKGNGYSPQWSTAAFGGNLRPDSDCTGTTMTGSHVSAYVVGTGGATPSKVRSKYSVEAPSGTGIGSILRVVGTTELVRTSAPNNVWRTYEQSLYLRIEPPKSTSCPDGFISVPGDNRFNTNDFCVSKYEAKNNDGKAVSEATGQPWVSISQINARAAAESACAGCKLITDAQWMTIAQNIMDVSSNWSGGDVGNGYIFRGHTDNSPATTLAASSDDEDGYLSTGNTSGDQRRTLRLNNGEVIWDFSGNAFEWSDATIASGKPGLAGETTSTQKDYNNAAIQWNNFPVTSRPQGTLYPRTQGVGTLYSNAGDASERAFLRGGSYTNGTAAGVQALDMSSRAPSGTGVNIGFRIVFEPLSSIRCPEGHVPVPGNSTFGTKNFCVGKYEAKNIGGVARSQAAGGPWVNISQANAITVAANACASCRLISEAEWLTVAHNALSVSSNWSGGAVGNGYIFSGHNDSSPTSNLAAGTDDSQGYYGTGNSSGNQRRTLQLNNGETVWDLSGNVGEWTSGSTTGGQPGLAAWAWREWNAISGGSLSPSPYPGFGTSAASGWSSTQGLGRVNTNSADTATRPFIRSGGRTSGANAGIFSLNLNAPTTAADVGFRTTSDPLPAVACSGGFVPVPGDSRFGTTDFCVGKYEAKNVGGVATSQPDGVPWGTISQNNAIAAAYAACDKCRLIGESEWLTIAHNLASVPSNWSGNAVGSGYIYRGHSDYSPTAPLAASSNDNDGYYGTGNTVGEQRRTLTLSNGQVIWDFAGNISEWTTGQITTGQPGAAGFAWREWNAISSSTGMVPNPFPSYGTSAASSWTSSHGIGRIHSDSGSTATRGFIRSGNSGDHANAGIFNLGLDNYPTNERSYIGFRLVQYP